MLHILHWHKHITKQWQIWNSDKKCKHVRDFCIVVVIQMLEMIMSCPLLIVELWTGIGQGGFDANAVATANILETSTPVIGGKPYYYITVLTRTADGDEGGKHQLITATVSDGKLYICKAQAGDKRWFKGARKFVESTASSFSVA